MTVESNTSKNSRKPRPIFPGRPSRFGFLGLFLPSIEWEMKIEEMPWRELEDDPVIGTFMRNRRRGDVPVDSPAMLENMRQALQKNSHRPGAAEGLAVLEGDAEARERLDGLREWGSFTFGRGLLTPSEEHYAYLEAHCEDADAALKAGDFLRAAKCISHSAVLSPYWRHGALERLADATTEGQTFEPRLVAWLELQIAVVARFSVCDPRALAHQAISGGFERLLEGPPEAPGAQWVRCLQRFSGANSLAKLLVMACNHVDPDKLPSEATFKRWCSGRSFPSEQQARAFSEAIVKMARDGNDASVDKVAGEKSLAAQFWVARRFDAALQFACLLSVDAAAPVAICKSLGSSSGMAWARESFRHWTAHWQTPGASGPGSSAMVTRAL